MLPAFQSLLQIMEDTIFNNIELYAEIIGGLICVSLLTLTILGYVGVARVVWIALDWPLT